MEKTFRYFARNAIGRNARLLKKQQGAREFLKLFLALKCVVNRSLRAFAKHSRICVEHQICFKYAYGSRQGSLGERELHEFRDGVFLGRWWINESPCPPRNLQSG